MKNYLLTKIKNHFPDNSVVNIEELCRQELTKLGTLIKKDARIAIAIGSRGIHNQVKIVSELVSFLKNKGAIPFIVPAMGSHGGATAEGQQEVLEGYGITEGTIGAPIHSCMETVDLSDDTKQIPAFMDKLAYESDGVILINRIKPHTDFRAPWESGLTKMAVIGLGKEQGARSIHNLGINGLKNLMPKSAKLLFQSGRILAGIALVENAYDKTMLIKTIPAPEIMNEEVHLLKLARKNMPHFPVDLIDVLWIDQMGKDISGVGMDPNIIGRIRIFGQEEPETPKIKSIVASDLTGESHGNATGAGLADIITRKLYRKIDFRKTYKNSATSSFLERAKIPFVAETDAEAMELAIRNCGLPVRENERIIRIKDTLHLDEMYVSAAILNEIKHFSHIEIITPKTNLLDSNGKVNAF